MKRIASFEIDHDLLTEGLYTSRVDGDITTYALRFIRPNTPPFLPNATMHTIEHLFATYVRNSAYAEQIIYFGPMGCRTGFYFLVRDLAPQTVVELVGETLRFIADFEGVIPGSTAVECGNYREHDLPSAKAEAVRMSAVLSDWTTARLTYPHA